MCVTNCHDMTIEVKVVLNPNTTDQPIIYTYLFLFSFSHCVQSYAQGSKIKYFELPCIEARHPIPKTNRFYRGNKLISLTKSQIGKNIVRCIGMSLSIVDHLLYPFSASWAKPWAFAESIDQDQTAQNVQSDLDLCCLHVKSNLCDKILCGTL